MCLVPGQAPAASDALPEGEDRQACGKGYGGGQQCSGHAVAPSRALSQAVTASRAEAPNVAGIVMPVG